MAETLCDTKSFTIALKAAVAEINMLDWKIWRTPPAIPEGESDWVGVDVINNTNNFDVEFKLRLLDHNNIEKDDWPELGWFNLKPNEGVRVGTYENNFGPSCLHMKDMPAHDITAKVELCVRKKGWF